MKAIVYNKKRLPDKLIYCDIDKPKPNNNEVLIKIITASVNAADYRSMKMKIIPKNKIFGSAIAGKVESVGKNILRFKPGDEVIGELADYGFGGFAEYTTTPEKALVLKPEKVVFADAAALPVAATTALQALQNKGSIQKGQKVLIVGSGGGVGTFSVQLAKYFGAEVTAVCSTENSEQALALGADYVIDYTKENFATNNKSYDLILAVNGNYLLSSYKRILNTKGKYVMVGGDLPQVIKSILFGYPMSFGSKKMYFLAAKSNQKDLEFIVKLVESGKIKPVIDRFYPLENVPAAMQYLGNGHSRGKVVINVG